MVLRTTCDRPNVAQPNVNIQCAKISCSSKIHFFVSLSRLSSPQLFQLFLGVLLETRKMVKFPKSPLMG